MTSSITLTIDIPNGAIFGSKVQGEWLPMDLTKVHNSWLIQLLMKGAQRQVNDNAKGDTAKQKLDVARLIVEEITSGEPIPLRAVRASQVTPLVSLARQFANKAIKEAMAAAGQDTKLYTKKTIGERVAMQDTWLETNQYLVEAAQEQLDREAKTRDANKVDASALAALFGGDS